MVKRQGERAGRRESGEAAKRYRLDERVQLLLGLFTIFFGLFLLLAFISHCFTWAGDQSLAWQDILHPFSVEAENIMGPLGATLAAVCMTRGFGLAAFVLPLLVLLYGLRILRAKISHWARRQLLLITGMLLGSVVLGYLFGGTWGYLGYGLGGAYGYYLSQWCVRFLGYAGAGLVFTFLSVAYLVWMNAGFGKWLVARGRELQLALRTPRPVVAAGVSGGENKPEEPAGPTSSDPVKPDEPQAAPEGIEAEAQEPEPADSEGLGSDENGPDGAKGDVFTVERPMDAVEPAGGVQLGVSSPGDIEQDLDGEYVAEPAAASGGDAEQALQLEVETHVEEETDAAHFGVDEPYDPTLDLASYQFPPLELLEDYESDASEVSEDELIRNKDSIVDTLQNYGISIDKIKATIGPTVTLYEIVPAPGVRISKIKNLEDDIALSLAALGIRIIAPIPGKGTVGIEVPNKRPSTVSMLSVLRSKRYQESDAVLPIALGRTISNEPYVVDLAKMPHLLVAGATGQGKSVGLNAIIASLLYRKHPAQLKFVLVDPKKVELTLYSRLEKHFLAKIPSEEEAIITDTDKVINTLNSLCIEMDARYDLLKGALVRNIKEYNEKFVGRRLNPEKGHRYLPYIVVIIDEFADLIMTAGREVELPIARLAQLARAVGIHLVIATQRPTTNIITGLIKANFPARIAFRVTSMIDSRTILDSPGANQLIGRGDMLVSTGSDLVRVQCAFLDTPEVARITDFIGNQRGYPSAFELPEYEGNGDADSAPTELGELDPYFDDIARMVVEEQRCSTSAIQRKYSIGYNRAGRIVDQLEIAGIVGKQDASKPREVLIADMVSLERVLQQLSS